MTLKIDFTNRNQHINISTRVNLIYTKLLHEGFQAREERRRRGNMFVMEVIVFPVAIFTHCSKYCINKCMSLQNISKISLKMMFYKI